MEYANRLKIIADNLRKSEKVNALDRGEVLESEILAHSFLDIEESSKFFLDELLPKLEAENLSEEEINEVLFDIGEELRHILYHIKDPRFFEYLKEDNRRGNDG